MFYVTFINILSDLKMERGAGERKKKKKKGLKKKRKKRENLVLAFQFHESLLEKDIFFFQHQTLFFQFLP